MIGRLRHAALALAALLALTSVASSQAVDRIGVPGPLTVDGTAFGLAFSANPNPRYFKQEYVPAGQNPKTYTKMVLVEAIAEGSSVKSALASQTKMLNARKRTDPLVNFATLENRKTGEVILDFILGGKDASGREITEWNVYRYAPFGNGVMLFAVSHRAYGDDEGLEFLRKLKESRQGHINAVAQMTLPAVTVARPKGGS